VLCAPWAERRPEERTHPAACGITQTQDIKPMQEGNLGLDRARSGHFLAFRPNIRSADPLNTDALKIKSCCVSAQHREQLGLTRPILNRE
jgi:hypothetical protein